MSLRHSPAAQRPRKTPLDRGAHALSDTERRALLLGSGTRGCSGVALARTRLSDTGSLRDLLSAQAARG
jgi:DNA repair protein RadC